MSEKETESPKTTLEEIKAKLNRLEATTGSSGAIPRAPKQMLLDASDVAAKKPDKRLRWLNLRSPEKMAGRLADGYRVIPNDEGGRRLGDEMVLAEMPREIHEERVAALDKRNRDLVDAPRREFENAVEGVARSMRDNHGIKVTAEQLMRL